MRFSPRSFIRKRLISLATTLSVSATSLALAQDPRPSHPVLTAPANFAEQQFMFDNDLAISNMNRAMLIRPSGDVDRDFVNAMIPHHEGEIEAARGEVKYGHNEQRKRLAQATIAQQEQQVSLLRDALGESGESPRGRR